MKLRALAPDDAPAVAALHATSWRSAYRGIVPNAYLDGEVVADRQAVWAARLLTDPSPQALGHVIEDAGTGELVGFAYALRGHDPLWGTLVDNLHVHPARKGRGLGRQLLQAVARSLAPPHSAQPLHLWVLDANEPAKRFYARLGAEFAERSMSSPFGGVPLPEWRCVWRDPAVLLLND